MSGNSMQDLLSGGPGGISAGVSSSSASYVSDTGETVNISALALLKMLKHGRAGVPLEVMGIMLGTFVDDYTIDVVDVFAMPQSGTGVSVEAVDPVFQKEFLDKLDHTGRKEKMVGWYHSHPGFGCWLSSVDVNTAMSFEQLHHRSVSVVIDPIQSVKGKIVIDAFRTIPKQAMLLQQDPRQTTSHAGFLNKPSLKALMHGLNRGYYSLNITYRKDELVEEMLINLRRTQWYRGLVVSDFQISQSSNESALRNIAGLAKKFSEDIMEETEAKADELRVARVGRIDPKKHLATVSEDLMGKNVMLTLATMLDTVLFD